MSHGWKKINEKAYLHEPTGAVAEKMPDIGWEVSLGSDSLRLDLTRNAGNLTSLSGWQVASEWAEAKKTGRPWIGKPKRE